MKNETADETLKDYLTVFKRQLGEVGIDLDVDKEKQRLVTKSTHHEALTSISELVKKDKVGNKFNLKVKEALIKLSFKNYLHVWVTWITTKDWKVNNRPTKGTQGQANKKAIFLGQ